MFIALIAFVDTAKLCLKQLDAIIIIVFVMELVFLSLTKKQAEC